jgi:hypothetical protein
MIDARRHPAERGQQNDDESKKADGRPFEQEATAGTPSGTDARIGVKARW